MSQKLQELTQKLYQEGVEKARAEAAAILDEAGKKKDQIISEADKEAETLVNNGKKEAEQLVSRGKAELEMAAGQAVSALKQKIVSLLSKQTLDANIKSALDEKAFIKDVIKDVISKWDTSKQSINLELSKEKEGEFSAYLNRELSSLLGKGLEISFEERMNSGFKVKAADGSFVLSFTDQDFAQYFQSYVKEKIRALLFTDK